MAIQLEDFTVADLDIMIEAMDAWISKDLAGSMMEDMVGAITRPRDEIARAQFQADMDRRREKRRLEQKQRDEIATLLKTKLILQKRDLINEGKEVRLNA